MSNKARKSRRKRKKMRQATLKQPVVMVLVEGAVNVQQCPECQTTVRDHAIQNRICFRCSPESAEKQSKAHAKAQEGSEVKTRPIPTVGAFNAAYDKTEAFLRAWHADNKKPIPDCFLYWNIHFMSRGSALREWSKAMNFWMKDQDYNIVTDMTPHHTLEEKIRARREQSGTTGPEFRTEVQRKADNLRGVDEVNEELVRVSSGPQGRYSSTGGGYQQVKHRVPAIGKPEGTVGSEFVVI